MTNALSELLSQREWLMADGATGTNLFNMGLMSGDAPELWNVTETAKINALYEGSVDAGSEADQFCQPEILLGVSLNDDSPDACDAAIGNCDASAETPIICIKSRLCIAVAL